MVLTISCTNAGIAAQLLDGSASELITSASLATTTGKRSRHSLVRVLASARSMASMHQMERNSLTVAASAMPIGLLLNIKKKRKRKRKLK